MLRLPNLFLPPGLLKMLTGKKDYRSFYLGYSDQPPPPTPATHTHTHRARRHKLGQPRPPRTHKCDHQSHQRLGGDTRSCLQRPRAETEAKLPHPHPGWAVRPLLWARFKHLKMQRLEICSWGHGGWGGKRG